MTLKNPNPSKWKNSRIQSSDSARLFAALFGSMVLSLILYLAYPKFSSLDYSQAKLGALVGIAVFLLTSVFVFVMTVREILRWLRYGRIILEMNPFPGSIGGQVGGTLFIKGLSLSDLGDEEDPMKVSLQCLYSYISTSGKNKSRVEEIQWQAMGVPRIKMKSNSLDSVSGLEIDFIFSVPPDLPETDVLQNKEYYLWKINLKGNVKGVDLNSTFEIPVFKNAAMSSISAPVLNASEEKLKQEQQEIEVRSVAKGNFNETMLIKVMRIEEGSGNLILTFPMFRDKLLSIYSLVFGISFSGAAIAMSALGFLKGGVSFFSLVFSIPFFFVGLGAMLLFIYNTFNELKVEISNEQVRVERRLFFILIKSLNFTKNDILSIETLNSGSEGQGYLKKKFFKIAIKLKNGQRGILAESIEGEHTANAFKDYLTQKMGM